MALSIKHPEADRLAREGRRAEAESRYGEALATLPEAARAQAYLGGLTRDGDTTRASLLREGLSRAESAFAGKRYAEALSLWKEALAYLPESAERVGATVDNIASSGAEEAVARTRREQSSLAAPILAKAAGALEAKNYDIALPLYLEIVAKYPQASQAAQAARGIESSANAMSDRATAEIGPYVRLNPELVAAVSEAGGLGIVQPISLAYVHGRDFRAGLRRIRELTAKPVGLNVIVEKTAKAYEERMRRWLDVALEEGIRFVVTALGVAVWCPPDPATADPHAAGTPRSRRRRRRLRVRGTCRSPRARRVPGARRRHRPPCGA